METRNDPAKKTVMWAYALFGVSLLSALVPSIPAAAISLASGLGVLVMAYALRAPAEKDSLLENHMTFIIRTIWIGSFYAMVFMIAASFYLLQNIDNVPLMPCIDKFINMGHTLDVMDPEGMFRAFESCRQAYWQENLKTFIVAGAIAAGPVLLFFILRYARGFSRAIKYFPVQNVKSWL